MVSERDRILNITNYLESLGIEVHLKQNKARGNKGFFKVQGDKYRIDISKDIPKEHLLKTLSHEFAHFIHYKHDKTLQSLEFIFGTASNEEYLEDLLSATVDLIPKDSISPLFELKTQLSKEIKNLKCEIKNFEPNKSEKELFGEIEKRIRKSEYKYLLQHDNVKVLKGFCYKLYSIKDLSTEKTPELLYLKMKSKQRGLRRINSKISRLNRYYNQPTELWARSFETYISNRDDFMNSSPKLFKVYEEIRLSNRIPSITNFIKLTMS